MQYEVDQHLRIVQAVGMVAEEVPADYFNPAAGLAESFGKDINIALRRYGQILSAPDTQNR